MKAMLVKIKAVKSRIFSVVAFLVITLALLVPSAFASAAVQNSQALTALLLRINKDAQLGREFFVTVVADGKKQRVYATDGSVKDALNQLGLSLGEYDKINYKPKMALKPKMEIKVTRVTFGKKIKTVKVNYKTKKTKTDSLYVGQQVVTKKGRKGSRTDYFLTVLFDKKHKRDVLLASIETKKPIAEEKLVGTKTNIILKGSVNQSGLPGRSSYSELPAKMDIELDVNGKPIKYKKKLVGPATAYWGGGITATGQRAMPGRVAVDPREIPYGSKLYIVTTDGSYIYGYCEASDTGTFIYTTNVLVDLYFHSLDTCCKFGRRNVEVYVLQ